MSYQRRGLANDGIIFGSLGHLEALRSGSGVVGSVSWGIEYVSTGQSVTWRS